MKVIPFVHEGLGNSSYLIDLGGGEGAVVDPDRSVARYIAAARANGLEVSYVLETHLHADFVTGSRELQQLGARLLAPAAGALGYEHQPLSPGAVVTLGEARVEAVGSAGHTPEHLSFVVESPDSLPMLFSGGSLIVGGAARTDLISPELTDGLTRAQFRTAHEAFAKLPDETILYPTHGAGSFCSTGSGGERISTLGEERRTNPVLRPQSEDDFVSWFTASFPAAPSYFFRLRAVNQEGPRPRTSIPAPPVLEPAEFAPTIARGVVVDTRPQADFVAGYIPGAISIAFRPAFATWLGWLIPPEVPVHFVLGDEQAGAVIDECLLVGHERFGGILRGGMTAWERSGLPVQRHSLVDAGAAARLLSEGALAVDVREPSEAGSHLPGAKFLPLGELMQSNGVIPRGGPVVVYCGHGERSATGLSLLARAGFTDLYNLDGGIGAWQAAGLDLARQESRTD
ncbi:MAG: rhodanese-like domain-containing protein [Dehalococcoidia bacterium]